MPTINHFAGIFSIFRNYVIRYQKDFKTVSFLIR
jgi:hypothetical protein